MANTIQLRRGTASQWTAANSLLASGEIGFETDTNKFKIGTGTASWSELPYAALEPLTASGSFATLSYVDTAISNLVASAPGALDTLNELAAALNDDENFATTVTNSLAEKLDSATASAVYLRQDTASATYYQITDGSVEDIAEKLVLRDTDQSFDISRIDFNISASPGTINPGELIWNNEDGTLDLGMGSGVTQSIGMEFYMPPTKNDSGVDIPDGSFVMATGAQGDRMTIAKAITDGSVDPMFMIGVATQEILNGAEDGLITTDGIVRDINTASYTVGTVLYPDPNNPGGLTDTQPTAPAIRTAIAIVLRQHENTGRIYVRMSNGSVLGGTDSNVNFTSIADNDIITYNTSASYWENQNLASAIQEVDGSGSGIDADLLDGEEGSYYLAAGTASATYLTQTDAEATYLPISASSTLSPVGYLTEATASATYLRQDTASATYAQNLSDLNDVDVSAANAGEFLKYDGANWVSASVYASGGTGADEIFYSTTAPESPAVGDIWIDSDASSEIYDLTAFITSASAAAIYAPLDSADLIGTPTAPTAASGTNTTQIATTAFVRTEVSNLVNSAPPLLDTLNELAAALGDDPNYAASTASAIGNKLDITVAAATYLPISASATLGGSSVEYSADPPSTPEIGTLWVESDVDVALINTNIDGGSPGSVYVGITALDAGGA